METTVGPIFPNATEKLAEELKYKSLLRVILTEPYQTVINLDYPVWRHSRNQLRNQASIGVDKIDCQFANYGAIRMVPVLLVLVCARMKTVQVPGTRLSGSLTVTWVKSEFATERTSCAGTSKI
jgi:hypothetical protein